MRRGIRLIYRTLEGKGQITRDSESITVIFIPDYSLTHHVVEVLVLHVYARSSHISFLLDLYLDLSLSDNSSPSLTVTMVASTRKVKIHSTFAPHSRGNKVHIQHTTSLHARHINLPI
jgi:hypothetical protein